jgi:hypothetical protein
MLILSGPFIFHCIETIRGAWGISSLLWDDHQHHVPLIRGCWLVSSRWLLCSVPVFVKKVQLARNEKAKRHVANGTSDNGCNGATHSRGANLGDINCYGCRRATGGRSVDAV